MGGSSSSSVATPPIIKHHPFGPGATTTPKAAPAPKTTSKTHRASKTATPAKTKAVAKTAPVEVKPVVDHAAIAAALKAGLPAPVAEALGRSGVDVPLHSAVPTASWIHGWLSGLGARRARPLPAHSIVTASVTRGSAWTSRSDSSSGRRTCPSTRSRHVVGSTSGMS